MVAKTIRQAKLGKHTLRLAEDNGTFYGLSDGKVRAKGDHPDHVWRQLQDEAGKSDPQYFGYDGARSRFMKFFPGGFHSDDYKKGERDYKVAAKDKLDKTVPLDDALTGTGYGEAVLSAYRNTNLLAPMEKTKLQDVFRGPDADKIVQAAARFTKEMSRDTLSRLEHALKPHETARWTVVTYLPYLWQPERHMFLKPEVTKDYAARVGHPFASVYEAGLKFDVYESLLHLVEKTNDAVSSLQPVDGIDIQSFIWVVGAYQEASTDADI